MNKDILFTQILGVGTVVFMAVFLLSSGLFNNTPVGLIQMIPILLLVKLGLALGGLYLIGDGVGSIIIYSVPLLGERKQLWYEHVPRITRAGWGAFFLALAIALELVVV
jgi:hypothetical protein